jgi:hypothetical protein
LPADVAVTAVFRKVRRTPGADGCSAAGWLLALTPSVFAIDEDGVLMAVSPFADRPIVSPAGPRVSPGAAFVRK